MAKLGVFLVIFQGECTLIFLGLDLKLLEVVMERLEKTFTIGNNRKTRQVTTNFAAAALIDVGSRILLDCVDRVPFA
jgi:hypothetical protein